MKVQLRVNGPRGDEKVLDLCEDEEDLKRLTVLQLKKRIVRDMKIGDDIRMVFRTEILEESSLLLSYGIKHMSTIHTLLMLPGGMMGRRP
ncbi:hypothetical protein JOQ06_020078 [Pogonophryne albipinna]|uniref:Ubiquitin-like domain-containing protein n=1 Tax=Pogonophryne albipinna TaxID=1090488 RepID=A0AAD6FU61_9TELE|nr:hypothetical protein JOQ06_020078 [Pogonophryne albipinna]